MIQSYWTPVLALLGACAYVVAVMALKRASSLGADLWHSTFLSNILAGLIFQLLLVFGGQWPPLVQFWQPAVVALLFLGGQTLTLWSLNKGDVSIATPVLGLKIILVAVSTTVLLGQRLPWNLWASAALATAGIVLLGNTRARPKGASVAVTVITAAGAAACYAVFDVLVQKFSPQWGLGRFLPVTIAFTALASFALLPLFPYPLGQMERAARKWLTVGATLFALQSLVIVAGIAHFGAALASNVVYSSRGLMSILAVAWLGHYFHLEERQMSPEVLRWRIAGGASMFAAILLVLWK